MTYLNQALLFGAAAFAIPLIIHILNRSRFKTVDWGAMHLLDSVIKVNHRRFRIDQLILLLVRCAIPALLAFCLARPVLTGAQALEGDTPVSLVVVLDNSYSMETRQGTNSRYDEAVTTAAEIIEASPRGTDFSVVLTGETPTTLFERPIFDADAVVRKLKATQPGYGPSDVRAALNEAYAIASGMSHPRREIIIVSDFQKADWMTSETSPFEAMDQLSKAELGPSVTYIPVGKSSKGNISIDSLDYPSRVLGIGQRLDIRANVRNHGSENVDTVRIVLKIDGQEENVSQIGLAGNSSSQALFPVTFSSAGSHVVEFTVMADDELKADNQLSAAFSVWDSLPVLLVDGAPSREPLQGETDFLSVALTPFTFGRLTLADLIESRTISPRELSDETTEGVKVIVLANVDKLKDEQLNTLREYVQAGGALFVTAGNKIDLKWSRENFYADGTGLLPLPYAALQGEQQASEGAQIVAQRFEHPALDDFNDARHGDLSVAEIRRWYRLDDSAANVSTDRDTDTQRPVVIARLTTGDPLLVEKQFGDGVVLQLTTSCDADWNDLPMQPIYVPLMQQLVTYLASRNIPPQNIATGSPAIALLGSEETSETLSVTTPTAVTQLAQTYKQGQLHYAQFEQTLRPGVYKMTLPSDKPFHFVTTTSREESKPETLAAMQLVEITEPTGGSVLESASEYLKQDRLRRNGREIWKYVLAGFLTLMFLELVLQQRFARVRV